MVGAIPCACPVYKGNCIMGLVLVRIDNRLIHGQVIAGWSPRLGCEQIVVANDQINQDELRKKLMSIAAFEFKPLFLTLKDAADQIKQGKFEKKRTILLVESPQDALFLTENGVNFTTINIGPMEFSPEKTKILPSIFLNEEDKIAFEKLSKNGIKLEVQLVPSDPKIDLNSIVR